MPGQTGLKITKYFHPTFMVHDLADATAFYQRVFGATSLTIPYSDQGHAYRTLTVIADTCIENISPEQTFLSQFRMYLDIVGNHWFFPCFYVADMQDAVYQLHHRHRIRLTASGSGFPVVGLPPGNELRTLLYTHPADTGIMWEFWEGEQEWFRTNPLADPRMKPGWVQKQPASDDKMAVEYLAHQTVLVRDPTLAIKFLVGICGGQVFSEGEDALLGSRSTWISLGEEPVVFEIAQPIHDGPRRDDLLRVGNTAHSVTFKVRNLESAAEHLMRQGVALETRSDRLIITDPETCHGLRFGFTQSLGTSDPRGA
jgi:catechol 2,3-dioxygenase-like lactoylglutathione lyase family enzyme